MFIKQISIFVENLPGRISEVIGLIGDNGIDIGALSLADTPNYGVLRMIVSEPSKAHALLISQGFTVKINNVLGVAVKNEPGGLAFALSALSSAGITIEYLYAFVGKSDKGALVVIRTDKKEDAAACLLSRGIEILDMSDIFTP